MAAKETEVSEIKMWLLEELGGLRGSNGWSQVTGVSGKYLQCSQWVFGLSEDLVPVSMSFEIPRVWRIEAALDMY